MKFFGQILLITVLAVIMGIQDRERRSLARLGFGHTGAVVLGVGFWIWRSGAVVSSPVVTSVAVVGPTSGPVAVVGGSSGSAVVAGPSGAVVAPSHGVVGLGLGHPALVAGHGLR